MTHSGEWKAVMTGAAAGAEGAEGAEVSRAGAEGADSSRLVGGALGVAMLSDPPSLLLAATPSSTADLRRERRYSLVIPSSFSSLSSMYWNCLKVMFRLANTGMNSSAPQPASKS